VEVQVFGDADGTVVHYFTRDCSVQRRHQKVVEEAPAPGLSDALRDRLHTSAVSAARSVDYRGAGTVEFLVAGDECYFLEMNTRLQVEHRVTEQICGVDLVELQLRVAAGEVLGLSQESITADGHAIEVRLYAEDPANDFMPSVGTIDRFDLAPGEAAGVRCDSGVRSGDDVSPHFDPMLAKVVVHAPTRTAAAGRLARALRAMRLHGLITNRDSLVAVLEHEAFAAGHAHTGFFDDHPDTLTAAPPAEVVQRHAIAAALALRARRDAATTSAGLPKVARAGWRNVGAAPARQAFAVAGSPDEVLEVVYGPPPRSGARMPVAVTRDGNEVAAGSAEGVWVNGDRVEMEVDGLRVNADVNVVGDLDDPGGCRVWVNDRRWQTELRTVPRFATSSGDASAHGPSAPVPGTVVAVEVTVGDTVLAGQTLVVMEAMKMEHRLTADIDGAVIDVLVAPGDQVDARQVLVVLEAGPKSDRSGGIAAQRQEERQR
jgi:propionyl-CoA carboxylase alpha chain